VYRTAGRRPKRLMIRPTAAAVPNWKVEKAKVYA
jgi:hypothetical protein